MTNWKILLGLYLQWTFVGVCVLLWIIYLHSYIASYYANIERTHVHTYMAISACIDNNSSYDKQA